MSHKISDTLIKTWDALIDERLNISYLAIGFVITGILIGFAIHNFSPEKGISPTAIVAIFGPITAILLFVMKNIHDKNIESKKKDDLALFFLEYLFAQHGLLKLNKELEKQTNLIQKVVDLDIKGLKQDEFLSDEENANDRARRSLNQIINEITNFLPIYFQSNIGSCFELKQETGAALLNVLETIDTLKCVIEKVPERENNFNKNLTTGSQQPLRKPFRFAPLETDKAYLLNSSSNEIFSLSKKLVPVINKLHKQYTTLQTKKLA